MCRSRAKNVFSISAVLKTRKHSNFDTEHDYRTDHRSFLTLHKLFPSSHSLESSRTFDLCFIHQRTFSSIMMIPSTFDDAMRQNANELSWLENSSRESMRKFSDSIIDARFVRLFNTNQFQSLIQLTLLEKIETDKTPSECATRPRTNHRVSMKYSMKPPHHQPTHG
jgi:hypothetical protein